MPASIDLVENPEIKEGFERGVANVSMQAIDRLKLYKLVWEMIG